MATNPFDQFDAQPQAAPAPEGGNPFDQFDTAAHANPLRGDDKGAFASAVQGFNGAIPFGNRLTAGAAALANYPIAKISNPELTLSDLYDTARANQKATSEAHPTANMAGTGAGIVNSLPLLLSKGATATTPYLGDAANAIQKGNTAIADSLGSGNLLARTAKGSAFGSATSALYGAGSADDGKMLEGAGQGAVTGALVGGGFPVAGAVAGDVINTGKNALTGAFSKSPEAIQDAASALKGAAGNLYTQMRQIGATYNQPATSTLTNSLDTALSSNHFIPELNKGTVAIVEKIKDAAANGTLGLDDLDQYRRLLGRVGGQEDGVSAGKVKAAIDNFVSNTNASHLSNGTPDAVKLLQQGRAEYAQASKYEDIADILSKADGDANKIKAGLKRFLLNDSNTRGWSKDEVSALKDAASNSGSEGLLKMAGKFGFDIGGSINAGNGVGAVVGYAAGGGATPIAGTVARQAQKYAARGKAQNLLNTLEGSGSSSISGVTPPALSMPASGAAAAIQNAGQQPQIPAMAAQPAQQLQMQPMSNNVQVPASTQAQMEPQKPDLYSRVMQAESGGNQKATSPKGAIGVMQIMPGTAKEAAQAAGLPYDPFKLRTDKDYNAALGKAYLDKMLAKYNGDEAHALAAYNWGPGNVDMWLKSGANPAKLPKETQNYLRKILG